MAKTHLEHVMESIPDLATRRILDVGAGGGEFLIDCAKRGIRATGIEYSAENVREAQERAKSAGVAIECVEGAAEHMPFADASFDFANVCEVIEHVDDPNAALREIRRVLAPQGIAYVSFPSRFSWYDTHFHVPFVNWLPRAWSDAYLSLLGKHKTYSGEAGRQRLSDMHYYTYGGFKRLAEEAGFGVEDLRMRKIRSREKGIRAILMIVLYTALRPWYFRALHVLLTKTV